MNPATSVLSSPPRPPLPQFAESRKSCNTLLSIIVLLAVGAFIYWLVAVRSTKSTKGSTCGTKSTYTVPAVIKNPYELPTAAYPAAVPSSAVKTLTTISYDELQNIREPIVVAFTSPSCGHCVSLKPHLEAAATKSNVRIVNINHDDRAVRDLSLKGYPTIVYFDNGVAVKEFNQSRSTENLIAFAS